MKRDMDLARRILLDIEANPEATGPGFAELSIADRDPEEVSYHVMLLHEAGLIVATSLTSTEGFEWVPNRLTSAGHDFLDAARKDTLWQKAKAIAQEKTGGLSFDVLKALLTKLATEAVLGSGS